MSTLLDKHGLDAIEFGYSVDLKMVLIIYGKQNTSLKKPSPWCNGFAPLTSPATPHTIGSRWSCYNEWVKMDQTKLKPSVMEMSSTGHS